MASKIFYIVFVALLAFAPNAFGYECSIYEDKTNKFVLGSALIGESANKILGKVKKSDNCLFTNGKYMDCELRDTNDVAYLLEADKVIRKEVAFSKKNVGEKYILGISGGSSFFEVLEKLKEEKSIVWNIVFSENGDIVLSSDYCIKNAVDEIYSLYFVFDEDYVLKKVGSRLNW